MNIEAALIQMAYAQGGVISRTQALKFGFGPKEIHRRVLCGQWERVRNGIYLVIEMDDITSSLKAAEVILPSAVVSHEAAAAIHKFPGFELDDLQELVVTVPSYATHTFDGIEAHRNLDLMEHHCQRVDGVLVTTAVRTVFDLAHKMGLRKIAKLIDQLRMAKVVSLDDVKIILGEVARRGKPGTKVIRDYIKECQSASGSSPLEDRASQIFKDAGLPEPIREFPIPWDTQSRFDFAFLEFQIAIEVDGYGYHSDLNQFSKDRKRDREALIHGWRTLRFTFDDIFKRPHAVIKDIKAVMNIRTN